MLRSLSNLSRMIGLIGMFILAVLLSGCQSHDTQESASLAKAYAWKVDPTAHASLQEVQDATDWQSFDGVENWGIGTAVIWVRYTLRAALPSETEPWIVRVRPAILESLTLYDPVNDLKLTAGIYEPRDLNDLGNLNFNFRLQPMSQEREVYLRIQSQRSKLILTEIIPLRRVFSENKSSIWLPVLLATISICLAIWASLQWAFDREKIMGIFAIKQWISTVFVLSITGLMAMLVGDFISKENLVVMDSFFRIWTIATATWFFSCLINDYSPKRIHQKITKYFIIFIYLLPLLQFFDLRMEMTFIANASVFIGMPIILLMLFLSREEKNEYGAISKNILLIYFLFYTFSVFLSSLVFLNLMPLYPPLLKINLLNAFIDGFLIFFILQFRARYMVRKSLILSEKNNAAAIKLSQIQLQMVAEQQKRQEQSQFLHMLMHELKTPLSVVSLALGTKNNREENLSHASNAVKDMKAIIDRCILADQSQEPSLVQLHKVVDLQSLVEKIIDTMPTFKTRFQVLTTSSLSCVTSDEQLLKIILSNLLDNAAHYSDPLTPITIRLEEVKQINTQGLLVSIGNTPGLAGWPDEHQLFSKYYRAPGAERESGSGLGLFLSRQLANSLGGALIYTPTDRQIEFELWIPLLPA